MDKNSVEDFIGITGSNEETARYFLEAHNGSTEAAVNSYLESQTGPSSSRTDREHHTEVPNMHASPYSNQTRSTRSTRELPTSWGDLDSVRAPDQTKRARLIETASEPLGFMTMQNSARDPFRNFRQEQRRRLNPPDSEEAVSAKHHKLAKLFEPPLEIIFNGTFQEARTLAKEESKFLIVNIQKTDEFDCHRMNRDVWKDDTVRNVIMSCCIFWQQDNWSSEAKIYIERYAVSNYPHIGIIDPRTSRLLWQRNDFISAEDLIVQVSDTSSKYPMDSSISKPPAPSIIQKNSFQDLASEDQQLAAAIAASLQAPEDSFSVDKSSCDTSEEEEIECYEAEPEATFDSQATGSAENEMSLHSLLEKEKLPVEPEAGDKDSTRIQFKFSSGKQVVRRFRKGDPVMYLFKYVSVEIGNHEKETKPPFDLITMFPSISLTTKKNDGIEESGLCNASLIVKLL